MMKMRSPATGRLASAVEAFWSTPHYWALRQAISFQTSSTSRAFQRSTVWVGRAGWGKWGKFEQPASGAAYQKRSLSFRPLERAKEALNAARTKAWAAMPKLPQLPALPPKVQQFVSNVRLSGSLGKALSLQVEAFWQNYHTVLLGAASLIGACIIWKLTGTLWSSSMRMYVAMAILLGGYLYFHRRFSIDPEAVYRLGLYRLNTHSGILEVMGAPLAGSDLRAYVLTGGGIRLQGGWPKHRSRRVHMMFPLRGSERRGLVFLEAKKRKGQYDIKVLGVDVPSHGIEEERLYAIGDSSIYSRGGVLASLRDPLLKAHMLKEAHEHEDDDDDLKDEMLRQQEKEDETVSRARAAPKKIDDGGGMYAYERLYWGARDFGRRLQSRLWQSTRSDPKQSSQGK